MAPPKEYAYVERNMDGIFFLQMVKYMLSRWPLSWKKFLSNP